MKEIHEFSPLEFITYFGFLPNTKTNQNSFVKSAANFIMSKEKQDIISLIEANQNTAIVNGRQVGITTLISLYFLYKALIENNKTKFFFIVPMPQQVRNNIILQNLDYLKNVCNRSFNYSRLNSKTIQVENVEITETANLEDLIGVGYTNIWYDDISFIPNAEVSKSMAMTKFSNGKCICSSTPSIRSEHFQDIVENKAFSSYHYPSSLSKMYHAYDKEDTKMFIDAKFFPRIDKKNNPIKMKR